MGTDFPHLQFTEDEDSITWLWENTGTYSSKSAYKIISQGGKIKWHFSFIWSCKIPPSAKFFTFLLLQNKLSTKDVLRRRGIHLNRGCVCCQQCPVESALHIFFLCPFAVAVWYHVSKILSKPLMKIQITVDQIVCSSWEMVRNNGHMGRKEWACRFICVTWQLWKHRNDIIFRDQRLEAKALAYRCVYHMEEWLRHC